MAIAFWSLVLFLAFVYFEPSIVFPFLAETRAALVISILSLTTAIIAGARPPKAIESRLLLLLLIIGVVTSFISPIPFNEQSQLNINYLFKAIALYFLVSMIIVSKQYLIKFCSITLGFGFIVGIVSLLTVRAGVEGLKGGELYRMTNYFGGLGDDPNEFGAVMLALFPLPIAMMEGERSLLKRMLYTVVALTFILCIARTRSRGAFLGLLLVLVLMIWEYRKKFGVLLLFAFLIVFSYLHTHSGYWERIATIQSEATIIEDGSVRDRILQIQYAVQLIKLHPLTGVGIGNFVQAKITLLGMDPDLPSTRHVPHNAYLGLGAEIGIIGMLIVVLLLVISISNGYSSERFLKNKADVFIFYKISKGIRLGLMGFGVSIFFLSEQYNPIVYQWIAIMVAIRSLSERATAHDIQHISANSEMTLDSNAPHALKT